MGRDSLKDNSQNLPVIERTTVKFGHNSHATLRNEFIGETPKLDISAKKNSYEIGKNFNAIEKTEIDRKFPLLETRDKLDNDDKVPYLVYYPSYGGCIKFAIKKKETLIGRKEGNDIYLSDVTISKFHASVFRSETGITIVDKNSSNGIKVNNHFITPGVPFTIRPGDNIIVGSVQLILYEKADDIPNYKKKNSSEHIGLVSINTSDENIAIKAELKENNVDFKPVSQVKDITVLKEDYEKLRLAYELSKVTLTNDLESHFERSLELIFEILPVDRGVILLLDQKTGMISPKHVKIRSDDIAIKEIALSSAILKRVYESRKCLVTSDIGNEKNNEQQAQGISQNIISTVICVPLIGHGVVHGIMHLDSLKSVVTFSKKDLSVITAICNQLAIAIENSILMKEYEQNVKVQEYLSRFLPPHVVKKLKNPSELLKREGCIMKGTVIFVDIRGFTNMSEKSTPEDVVFLLNDYFQRLVRIIFKYGGIVDKYIGDALMAVFGTIEDQVDPEFRAVKAAFEFKQAISEMNQERAAICREPISIGVGVNTGQLLSGFIGSTQRMEYTVIGDTVNTSSRVCSFASSNQVLISEFTHEFVKERIDAIKIGSKQFKGKQKEVIVYEVLGIHSDDDDITPTSIDLPFSQDSDERLSINNSD